MGKYFNEQEEKAMVLFLPQLLVCQFDFAVNFSELCIHRKSAYKYVLYVTGIYLIIKYINREFGEINKMDHTVEIMKRNEQLFFENAEELYDDEVDQEDIDEYFAIQGATEEQLNAFEQQFQIKLPEDFKCVYKYKNGSGFISILWPQRNFYRGYRLLSLQEMGKMKSYFQNENRKMVEFPDVIDEKQIQQLDERIKPYLFCERWFPFAEYAGSLYLMLYS